MWQRWLSLVTGWRSSSKALTLPPPRGSLRLVILQMLIGRKNLLPRQQVCFVFVAFLGLLLCIFCLMSKSSFWRYHQSVSCHHIFLLKSEWISLGRSLHSVAVLTHELWTMSAELHPSFFEGCPCTHVAQSKRWSTLKLYSLLKINCLLRVLRVHRMITCTVLI